MLPKFAILHTIAQLCGALSSQLRHVSRVSRLGFVTAATSLNGSQPNFHDVWPSPGLVHYIYIFGGSWPWRNFARCKIYFASNLALSYYWQRYCTALEYWASATLCGIDQRAPPIFGRAAITLGLAYILVLFNMVKMGRNDRCRLNNAWKPFVGRATPGGYTPGVPRTI